MKLYLYVLFVLISFFSSTAGAVCGIGGGVIIKPVLDAFGVLGVETINLLSGCTVLGMSCYSVLRQKVSMSGGKGVDKQRGTPLAIGAAVGGIAGKMLFQSLCSTVPHPNKVGAVQAACLLVITVGTLIYTILKDQIPSRQVTNKGACLGIGLVLGIISSFLGIGGGPINLVVLFFFFSMEMKTAAQNSLYIILISQATSLVSIIAAGNVPEFSFILMVLMVVGGVSGGIFGQVINRKISPAVVDRLFMFLMLIIIGINIYNILNYIR